MGKVRFGLAFMLILMSLQAGPAWAQLRGLHGPEPVVAITFAAGADFPQLVALGWARGFEPARDGRSFSADLRGLSGGLIEVDDYVLVQADSITTYSLEASRPLSGSLSTPETLKMRAWTGTQAPREDSSPGVCAVLDLAPAPATPATSGPCQGQSHLQILIGLPPDAAGVGTFSLRPTGIRFA